MTPGLEMTDINTSVITVLHRGIRMELLPGSFENLITNLPDREFDLDELKKHYHLRWNEENAYRDIKYSLSLKALHSKK